VTLRVAVSKSDRLKLGLEDRIETGLEMGCEKDWMELFFGSCPFMGLDGFD